MLKNFITSNRFQNFIIFLIVLNCITLGLATSKEIVLKYGEILDFIDTFIIAVFTVEILLRIFVHKISFFKDPWSLFDFFVVAISLVPASTTLSILRVLRVLRLFRLLSVVPQMRTIIGALLGVIPGIFSVSMVLLLFFYVFSIMATNLFSSNFPQWFGSLGDSMYTLFQVMTLESWSMGIARPIMEVYPYAWIFFIIFILLVTFIMVNLFIGLIVDAIFTIKGSETKEEKSEELKQIEELKLEIKELKELIIKNSENR
ncbi:ion transporter [Arcobacter sp. CECT 8986]|uniref:ion transporter n=1 Tax=Arcobacter sp. CECT 8986 TaxID=2044507 RepID=UPI001009DBDD|nr:ion transporter [Arcobacter sp. CECT 8986]RXK01356.1 ion transporter [Arcobacter sp. CECT 8986]